MCFACLCSIAWLLAPMKFVDRIPDHGNALGGTCSARVSTTQPNRSAVITQSTRTISWA